MKYKILDLLKKRNDFISGQELGEIFSVSRTAIWKNISKLKDEGYNIISVSNKGYRLEDNVDILNESEIKYKPVVYVPEVDSTNNIAKEYANKGCEEGLLVVCDNQTAGKGRLGRNWISEKSAGLYMSIVLRPEIMPMEAPQLTLIAGIASVRAINKITNLQCGIKWPNDIIVNNKKLVGILTEMSAEIESVKYVVVGIGVNVNNKMFDDEIKNKATSIYLQTNKVYKRSQLASEITFEFMELYNEFCKDGFSVLKNEYNNLCINVGKDVKTVGKTEIYGKALGVNENGELIIETENGTKNVLSGEVSLRLEDNSYI
jgi:biotin--[acetyl-coA-carboxylase] ligase